MPGTAIRYDPQVEQALDSLGMPYEITRRGDFKITFFLDDARSQRVYVESSVDPVFRFFRKVRSSSFNTRLTPAEVEQIHPNRLFELLLDNGKQTFGAWGITLTNTGKFSITFAAPVPVGFDPGSLQAVMQHVALRAEEYKEFLASLAEE